MSVSLLGTDPWENSRESDVCRWIGVPDAFREILKVPKHGFD